MDAGATSSISRQCHTDSALMLAQQGLNAKPVLAKQCWCNSSKLHTHPGDLGNTDTSPFDTSTLHVNHCDFGASSVWHHYYVDASFIWQPCVIGMMSKELTTAFNWLTEKFCHGELSGSRDRGKANTWRTPPSSHKEWATPQQPLPLRFGRCPRGTTHSFVLCKTKG